MNEGRRLLGIAFTINAKGWGELVPRRLVRMRVRWIRREIESIECELANEFGVQATAAQLHEIETLLEQLKPLEQLLHR